MMRVKIGYQGGQVDDVNLQDPFKHCRWSLGLHLLDNGDAVLDNGIANADSAGQVYVNSIEVDGVPLMPAGNHILPARSLLPIRRSPFMNRPIVQDAHLPNMRTAWTAWGGSRAGAVIAAINAGVASPSLGFFFAKMGPWFPNFSGQPQPGATSGAGIEFLPGWERSSAYRLLLADHTTHRAALSYTDVATGKPLTEHKQERYALSRGWGKQTQLAEFCAPHSLDPNDDARIPRNANSGTCAYEQTINGMNRYNGCLPEDDQHLIRLYRHALAGWQVWGDPLCKFYLDRIAADTSLVWGAMPTSMGNKGAGWAGRAAGWACHLLKAVGHPDGTALDASLKSVRIRNGLHQRCAWSPTFSWNFSPDPWAGTAPYALKSESVTQSIEAAIIGHACSEPTQTALSLTQYGNPSHFMIVSDLGVSLDRHAQQERESFNVHACFAQGLRHAGRRERQELLQRIPKLRLPDDGKQYHDAQALLAGAVANPHPEHLALLVKALENS